MELLNDLSNKPDLAQKKDINLQINKNQDDSPTHKTHE